MLSTRRNVSQYELGAKDGTGLYRVMRLRIFGFSPCFTSYPLAVWKVAIVIRRGLEYFVASLASWNRTTKSSQLVITVNNRTTTLLLMQ